MASKEIAGWSWCGRQISCGLPVRRLACCLLLLSDVRLLIDDYEAQNPKPRRLACPVSNEFVIGFPPANRQKHMRYAESNVKAIITSTILITSTMGL